MKRRDGLIQVRNMASHGAHSWAWRMRNGVKDQVRADGTLVGLAAPSRKCPAADFRQIRAGVSWPAPEEECLPAKPTIPATSRRGQPSLMNWKWEARGADVDTRVERNS